MFLGCGVAPPRSGHPRQMRLSPPHLSAPAPPHSLCPQLDSEFPVFQPFFVALFSPLCNLQHRSLTWQRGWNRWRALAQLPRSQELLLGAVGRISSHSLPRSAKAEPKETIFYRGAGICFRTSDHMSTLPLWKVRIPRELISRENKRVILGKAGILISLPTAQFAESTLDSPEGEDGAELCTCLPGTSKP